MIVLPQTPHKLKFKRDKHSREHRERVAAENSRRQKIGHMLDSYEAARGPRPPITLPKLSILDDAE